MTPPRGIGDIIVSSRPYDEYLAMFGLEERVVLAGPVLDCPGGAGPFGAAVRARGGRAVSADPAYALPPAEIVDRTRAGLEHGITLARDRITSLPGGGCVDRRCLGRRDSPREQPDSGDKERRMEALH